MEAKHRGRIQVQGSDIDADPSYPWARHDPLPQATALNALEELKSGCRKSQYQLRKEAFERAERFIMQGPVYGPVVKTFQNRALPRKHRDARVDIEVLLGVAFT